MEVLQTVFFFFELSAQLHTKKIFIILCILLLFVIHLNICLYLIVLYVNLHIKPPDFGSKWHLFSIYMDNCDIDLFADDATFHANGKKKSEVEPKLQTDDNNSKSWAKHHNKQIHYDKTSCMTLGSRHRTQNEASKLDIAIDGNEIKQVDKQKLLGVYIDENLLWTAHNTTFVLQFQQKYLS